MVSSLRLGVRCWALGTDGPVPQHATPSAACLLPLLNDVLVRALVMARLEAERRLAPLRHGSGATDRGFAFPAAVGMVARVHDHAAVGGPHPQMAHSPRLPQRDVLVVAVAERADAGAALEQHRAS